MGQPRLTEQKYFRRLFERFPENEEKFNYKKFTYVKSHEKTTIICNAYNHEFKQSPGMHLRGCGCPDCNNMPYTNDEYFEKLFERYPENREKFDYTGFNYIGTYEEYFIKCNKHGHIFKQTAHAHMNGEGCPICAKMPMSNEEYFAQLFERFPDNERKYTYKNEYIKSTESLDIKCNDCGYEFSQLAQSHMKGQGCQQCYFTSKLMTEEEFKTRAKDLHNDFYKYHNVNYVNSITEVEIYCPTHGYYMQKPYRHLQGCKCLKCVIDDKTKTQEEFENQSNETHNNRYDYSLAKYINDHTQVYIICKTHGSFKQLAGQHIRGSGCPRCNMSKGELAIDNILTKWQIDYDIQQTFEDCKNINVLPFDFSIFENGTMIGLIEFQGGQHFSRWRSEQDDTELNMRKLRDKIKKDYCESNDIPLLEIHYKDIKKVPELISQFFPKLFPKQLDMFYKNPYKIECKDLSDVEVEEPEETEENFSKVSQK